MTITEVQVGELLRTKKIIVCCGAGGVGKTTTAAALSLAAARAGRRVLVLTIDPSKRLAETLGVSRNPPTPVAIPADRLAAAGIRAPASLDAWMLDPKLVADESVRRLTKNPADAERVLGNRIYQQLSAMVAGMHEYTAMEALHRLVSEGRYDLVVLDTPPSRHALDFLEAPRRLSKLIEGRAIQAFLPKADSIVTRAASKVIQKILGAVFGEEFATELVTFMSLFSSIFTALNMDVNTMRTFLSGPDVAFLLVTSPAPSTLAEAHFFQDKTRELQLPFKGFVLNRSRARNNDRRFPDETIFAPPASSEAKGALGKLQTLARTEQDAAVKDNTLLGELRVRAGSGATAIAIPELPQGADDMGTLITVADVLAAS
ncbi:MAG: Arsenical pump-driving ATPase [Myxococcaceae bacterium]|nr:Arsenical pump-driving ATPase [Myxococcaceae bacterium]